MPSETVAPSGWEAGSTNPPRSGRSKSDLLTKEPLRETCRVATPLKSEAPLIEERKLWNGITESPLEDKFRSVVGGSWVPMPDAQIVVSLPWGDFVGRYDFGYPECMVIFELDSEGWHMDPVSFQRDREKQNRVQMLGWTVYRFTWRQLTDDPESVIAVLASVLAGCGRSGRLKGVGGG